MTNNGDLSEFVNKKWEKVLSKNLVLEIEARAQIYLSKSGMLGLKNELITPELYR